MFFYGQRIIGAALDGRVVGDDHAFAARHAPNPSDDPSRVGVAAIKPMRRECADLKERRTRIEQEIDAVARQELAASLVTLPGLRAATLSRGLQLAGQDSELSAHRTCIGFIFGGAAIDCALQMGHRCVLSR